MPQDNRHRYYSRQIPYHYTDSPYEHQRRSRFYTPYSRGYRYARSIFRDTFAGVTGFVANDFVGAVGAINTARTVDAAVNPQLQTDETITANLPEQSETMGYAQFPEGVSSFHKTIYVGGKHETPNEGPVATWEHHYPQSIEIADAEAAAGLSNDTFSGVQMVKTIGTMLTLDDLASTVAQNAGAGQTTPATNSRVNLFAFNPDQVHTGSLVGEGGTSLIAAGASQEDYINFHNARWIIDMANATNNHTFVKMYIVKSKRDQPSLPEISWVYNAQSYIGNPVSSNLNQYAGTAVAGGASRFLPHTVPQNSNSFNNGWKVLGSHQFKLAAGADVKCSMNIIVKRTLSRQAYLEKKAIASTNQYPKGAICIMMVILGGVVVSDYTDGKYNGPLHGDAKVAMVVHKKYHFSFTGKHKRFRPIYVENDMPYGIEDTHQDMVDGDGVISVVKAPA